MPESEPNKISTPFAICATHVPAYTVSSRRKRLPLGLTVFAALVLVPWANSLVFISRGAKRTKKSGNRYFSKATSTIDDAIIAVNLSVSTFISNTEKKLNLTRDKEKKNRIQFKPRWSPRKYFQWNLDLPCTLAHTRTGITFIVRAAAVKVEFTLAFCIPSVISSPDCEIFTLDLPSTLCLVNKIVFHFNRRNIRTCVMRTMHQSAN